MAAASDSLEEGSSPPLCGEEESGKNDDGDIEVSRPEVVAERLAFYKTQVTLGGIWLKSI